MAMVCPKCNGFYERQTECPTCAVALEFSPVAYSRAGALGQGAGWQHTALGRIFIGLLLAQGLALGLRMFVDGGVITLPSPEEQDPATVLRGILLLQGIQALCLLVACALAGAGQHKGLLIGGAVGLCNAVIQLALQILQHQPINEVFVYGQPLLHAFIGAIGGFMGSLIWRPLPVLNLAVAGRKKMVRPQKSIPLFGGPIAWLRVLLGTAIVIAGVLSPSLILQFVLYHGQGQVQITSHMQSTLITWEIIALFILLGSGIAGFNTFNGPKQGLCVGIVSGFLVVGYQMATERYILEEMVFMAFVLVSLSLVGSWFACRLFPPVFSKRRFSETP